MAFPLVSTSAVETGTGGATICIWKKHFSSLYNEEASFRVQSFFYIYVLKCGIQSWGIIGKPNTEFYVV